MAKVALTHVVPGRSPAYGLLAFARSAILIGATALLLVELILRAIGFSRPVFYAPDPVVGWLGRPGAEGSYRYEGDAQVRISSAGFRDRERTVAKSPDVWRVAVLGDSYTEAAQVEEDRRFTSVIERLLNRCDAGNGRRAEVLNFGVSGFGTAQEYLLLKERVLRYEPDVVVLAFLPGNDVTDNVRSLDPNPASRPYVTLGEDGQVVWDRSFQDTLSFRIKSSAIYRAVLRASDFSRVLQAGYFTRDMWRRKSMGETARRNRKAEDAGEQGLSAEIYSPPTSPQWRQAWKIAERLIEEMNRLTTHSKARFVLVTLSSGVQVLPDADGAAAAIERHGPTGLFYADGRLHEFAVQRGIEVLSLAPALAQYAQRQKVFLHGFPGTARKWGASMSTLGSGHWNEEGHRVAGELIARYLCPKGPSLGHEKNRREARSEHVKRTRNM